MPRTSRPGGRPPFQPTAAQRAQVEQLAAVGVTQTQIALLVVDPATGRGISEPTLRKHFELELQTGGIKATAAVASSLFQKATGKGQGSVIAAIFWLKTRGGWREAAPEPKAAEPDKAKAEAPRRIVQFYLPENGRD